MIYKRFWKVLDGLGKLRFESVNKTECEFFLKRLLQKMRPGDKRPQLVEVER